MTDRPLQELTADKALDILKCYAQRNFGAAAQVTSATFRDDYGVWEAWVAGVEGYVKAYIVRLAPGTNDDWICRHITVLDTPPMRKGE